MSRTLELSSHSPTVADAMTWPVRQVHPSSPVRVALAMMWDARVRHLLVVRGVAPLGLVCATDLTKAPAGAPVVAFAHPAPFARPSDSQERVAALLRQSGMCAAPVCIPRQRWGIVTRGDLARLGAGEPWPRCDACGGHHRVREHGGAEVAFCTDCMDAMRPFEFDDLYVDLGGGD